LLGDGGGPAGFFEDRANFLGADQSFADIAVIDRHVEGDQAIAVLAIGLKTRAYPLRALAEHLRALRAFDSDFVVDHECPSWNYSGTFCASGLKAVFEPSLKLEREGCVMSPAAAVPRFCECGLVQIARAKVAVKVADRAYGSNDRWLNNAVTG
jgi:hypothetical protein